ncbi:methyltransferase [Specibacter sp. AOP5-B1-6]|uniref:methyltransferase n=1 Tax=Specibacter sp. AOP5-B1-6 TaxID=3457653 RepID=UPI00402B2E41
MKHTSQQPDETLVSTLRSAGCVYAEEEAAILLEAADSATDLARLLDLRVQGYPLEHIVGWAQFCGLRIAVAPGVFVPRRRSEFLVAQTLAALAGLAALDGSNGPESHAGKPGPGPQRVPVPPSHAEPHTQQLTVLDLCSGSGAVGTALAHVLPGCELHASDIDRAAVDCAAGNIAAFNGRAYCGDLFAAVPDGLRGSFDVIAANAPYVPSAAIMFMPQEARVHEPEIALDGGVDGLELHRRIAAQAPLWLRPGGVLLLESSARQAPASAAILASNGFSASTSSSVDFDGTVVTGRLAPRQLP